VRRKGSNAEEGLNAQAKIYQDQLAQLKLHHEQLSGRRLSDTNNSYDNQVDCLDSLVKMIKGYSELNTEDKLKRVMVIGLCIQTYEAKFNHIDGYQKAAAKIHSLIMKESDCTPDQLHQMVTAEIPSKAINTNTLTLSTVDNAKIDLFFNYCEMKRSGVMKSTNIKAKSEMLNAIDFLTKKVGSALLDIRNRGMVSKDVKIYLNDAIYNYEKTLGKYYDEQTDNILNLVKSTFTFKEAPKISPTAFFKTPTASPKQSPREPSPTDAPSSKNTTPRKD
jgi:hypothetical protein